MPRSETRFPIRADMGDCNRDASPPEKPSIREVVATGQPHAASDIVAEPPPNIAFPTLLKLATVRRSLPPRSR